MTGFKEDVLRDARERGHNPVEISELGAVHLFGCAKCRMHLEVWTSDEGENAFGPMRTKPCNPEP